MLRSAKALRNALGRISPTALQGSWQRALGERYLREPPPGFPAGSLPDPLWAGGPVRTGARYTPKGGAPALYLASDTIVAAKEVDLVFELPGGPRISVRQVPTIFFSVELLLVNVLDLTEEAVRKALRTNEKELTGPWRLSVATPPTHLLGTAVVASRRFSGIRAPSAKDDRGSILVVLPEQLSGPEYLEVGEMAGLPGKRLPPRVPTE